MSIDLTALWQASPFLCILAIAVVTAIFIVRLYDRTKRNSNAINEINNGLKEFIPFSDRIGRHDKDIEKIYIKIDNMSSKLDQLVGSLSGLKIEIGKATETKSPMQLNEIGDNILEKSFLKEIIDTNKNFLFEKVKEKNPENEADIDAACLNVIFGLYSNAIFSKTRIFAYENPVCDDVSINSLTISRIGAIYLRNLYINEN